MKRIIVILLIIACLSIMAMDYEKKSYEENIEISHQKYMKVNNRNGDVKIQVTERDDVRLKVTKHATKCDADLQEAQVEINNDKAELIIETKYKSKSNPNVSVDLDLELPRSLQLKEITSSNGNISLINCEGKSVVSTSNGGITIKECTGDFDLSTSNSSIFAQNIKGSLSATTSNGKITARVISYLKSLTTSNSSIEAEVLTLPQDLSISTNNGRIEVFLPEKLNAELLANTSNGSVKLKGVEVGTIDLGKTNLSGSLGHGGNKLRLTTSNSNIEINSINISSQ